MEVNRDGIVGGYADIIDPMLPYATDFDSNIYNIVKGSWDALGITTRIDQSFAFGTL